ncbi:MAG: methionyl-tRNA formyltransferase [Rhodobacter sp.]|nr:methionyl-tRNA formyltransferase [Rhodobacter sp.]
MRIVFMGSPDFSVVALNALNAAGHEIVCVYCQPPRPAGRGQKDRRTPVHVRAAELGLPIRHPGSLRSPEDLSAFAALNADIAVVAAYGLVLPSGILCAPKQGCVNIHASLLPRWRGAAPIHRAVMAGDGETGISIMRMDAGLDTGPVLLRAATPINATDTTGDVHDRLSAMGATLITGALDRLNELTPEPQEAQEATYAGKINGTETRVDWSRPAHFVDRQIRGLAPVPGAWTTFNGERVRLLSSVQADGRGKAGQVLDRNLTVACGTGAVRVTRLQRAGRRAMNTAEAIIGWKDAPGN